MKNKQNLGSIAALLVAASLGLPAMGQTSNTQNSQVHTGAATTPTTQTANQSNVGTQTATGQAPLPVKEHEGFWGHMNPFARKKWVNNQLSPVKSRLNELDELQAKNERDIQDVNRRAQNGIHAAQSTANEANQTATQASQTAGQAQQMAQEANDRTHQLSQTVANLDQYRPVNNLEIRFRPGQRSLNSPSRAALSQVVNQLQGQKGYVVEVKGYSPYRGIRGVEESQAMAQAVVRYFAEHNVPIWRIHEIAMGDASMMQNGQKSRPGSMVRVSLEENSLAGLNLSGNNGGSPIGATQPNSAQPSPQGAASQPAVPQ